MNQGPAASSQRSLQFREIKGYADLPPATRSFVEHAVDGAATPSGRGRDVDVAPILQHALALPDRKHQAAVVKHAVRAVTEGQMIPNAVSDAISLDLGTGVSPVSQTRASIEALRTLLDLDHQKKPEGSFVQFAKQPGSYQAAIDKLRDVAETIKELTDLDPQDKPKILLISAKMMALGADNTEVDRVIQNAAQVKNSLAYIQSVYKRFASGAVDSMSLTAVEDGLLQAIRERELLAPKERDKDEAIKELL